MADKAIAELKKEMDEHFSKDKAWAEGLSAGIEEMMKRIAAKAPDAKKVAMEAAIDIYSELAEREKKVADEMRMELAKFRVRVRAGELAGAGKK